MTEQTPTEFAGLDTLEQIHLASAFSVLTGLALRLDMEGHHHAGAVLIAAREPLADEGYRRIIGGAAGFSQWRTLPILATISDDELRMLSRALHRTATGISAAGHPAAPFFTVLYGAVSSERARRDEIALREVAELNDLMDKSGPIQ